MLTLRPAAERGFADFGWLQAHYSFSFANYYDPRHMGFGPLRVINQDVIGAGRGFGIHGHESMEIVTYVLEGALEHEDSLGHGERLEPGEVQLMSAGTGVRHSEFNGNADRPAHTLQMWVLPESEGGEPSYAQRAFPYAERRGRLRLVVSPDGEGDSLRIRQAARLFVGTLDGEERIEHAFAKGQTAWLHNAVGELSANGLRLGPGDGLAIEDEAQLVLDAGAQAEFVLWQFG